MQTHPSGLAGQPSSFPTPQPGASLLLSFRSPRTVLIVGSNPLAAIRTFSALEADARVIIMGKGGLEAACEEVRYRVGRGEVEFADMCGSKEEEDVDEVRKFLDDRPEVSLVCVTDTIIPPATTATSPSSSSCAYFSPPQTQTLRRTQASAQSLFSLCRSRHIPINVTDMPDLCDFTFASTHRFVDPTSHEATPLQIAVVTNGQGCRLSGRIRREIVSKVSPHAGTAVAKVGILRRLAKGANSQAGATVDVDNEKGANGIVGEEDELWNDEVWVATPNRPVPQRSKTEVETELESVRRRMKWVAQMSEYWSYAKLAAMGEEDMLRLLNDDDALSSAPSSGPSTTDSRTHPVSATSHAPDETGGSDIANSLHALAIPPPPPPQGRILLVGSGPGHPGLLTMATHNALTKHADLVLSDKLVPEAVLALIPEGVEVKIARKFPGNADGAQNEMMEAAVEAANRGLTVVRLKQGDPTVYGRAGEEVLYFRKHGFESVIIPGVSSALAGPIFAGIPVTQRGAAESFMVCTGVGRQGKEVKLPGYDRSRTLVILMGVARIDQIISTLLDAYPESHHAKRRSGPAFPRNTPIAIVERASMPDQRVIMSTLENVAVALERSGEQRPPGMIVVGWAVLSLWGEGEITVLDQGAEGRDQARVEKWLGGENWRVVEGFDNGWEGL